MAVPRPLRPAIGREPRVWVALGALTVLAVVFDPVPVLRGPAPYPPEWQWLRREPGTAGPITAALLVTAILLVVLAASDREWARRRARRGGALLSLGAIVLGFSLQLAFLRLEPGGALASVLSWTAYRTATSYYTVAVSDDARDPLEFLRRYHELLPGLRKSAKHASTHPPGPVLFFRGLLALFDRSPGTARAVLHPFGLDDMSSDRANPERVLASRATALCGGLLIALCGAATAWPIAVLARAAGAPPLAAGRLSLLWAVVPGVALMTPMLDQALALPVTGATACLASAATAERARSAQRWALAAGALGGVAVWLSYGAPVFLAFGGLAALALAPADRSSPRRLGTLALLAAAVTLGLFFAPALLGHHPLASARTALAIHREAFTAPRSYLLWLFFNPLDLAVFLGVPLAAAWAWRTARSARARPKAAIDRLRLATGLGLALIVLAGITRGEVGRIWIPLMPPLLVAAMAGPDRPSRDEALILGGLLAGLCLAMAVWWRVP
jgi:hypothetical protein